MASDTRYRIVGDITIKTPAEAKSKVKKVDLAYGTDKTTNLQRVAVIQSYQPLTPQRPYFLVDVQKCDHNATISVGIASSNIDRHAGQYNNTLGYHSNTGRIYTSWKANANTLGLPYGRGNKVGIYVTHFGQYLSTAMIFYDNVPIATRYHFETNREHFLPTITFSGGPVHLSVLWPAGVDQLPPIKDIPVSQWIRGPMATYDSQTHIFENRSKLEDLPVQSPMPLSQSFRSFIVTQEEVSNSDGKGASIGLATFSPLKPTPTCSLMKDYYTWFAKMKMKVGNSIGWGIFYEDDCHDDKAEQLCLVFVMFNKSIIDALFVLQPEGGFVPIVLLQPYATKVSIERRDKFSKDEFDHLERLRKQMLGPAINIFRTDKHARELSMDVFRKSEQVILDINDHSCRVSIPKSENTVHYIQFCQPLTRDRRFFFVELENISDECQVIIGVASAEHELNEAPGLFRDTVGYNSLNGHLHSNRKDNGNMRGHRCRQGDTMGVEIDLFHKEMSVVLFSKNFRPIGTRYLTLTNHDQYFPTILIESNGDPVDLSVHWQNRVSLPAQYSAKNPDDWCLPEQSSVDFREKMFLLPEHLDHSLCIQGPCSLTKKYNHFEIVLVDKFSDNEPPPAIALCTASPLDPIPTSQFKQDYLRFWPTGDAGKYLQQGDKIGWGILFPEDTDDERYKDRDQLIICYLTINRTISYVRVLCQPIGGFYPVIIAPPAVNRIKMEFAGLPMSTEDFTTDRIESMLADARYQMEQERLATNGPQHVIRETTGTFNAPNELRFANSVYTSNFLAVPDADEEENAEPIEEEEATTPPPVKSSTCTIA